MDGALPASIESGDPRRAGGDAAAPSTGLIGRILARLEGLPLPVACGLIGGLWCALSFFLYAPPALFLPLYADTRIHDLMRMAEHPLRRDLHEPILAYRLSMPILAYLLQIRGLAVLVLAYLANIAFIGALFAALRTRTTSRIAFIAVGLIALSQAGQSTSTAFGCQDALAHLCTAVLLLMSGPAMALVSVVGIFADERFVLALPFVVLWHWLGRTSGAPPDWRRSVTATIALAAGVAIAAMLRHMLTVGLIGPGIVTPEAYNFIGSNVAKGIGGAFRFGFLTHMGELFFAFRWLWIVPFAYLLSAPSSRMKWVTALILVGAAIEAIVIFWGGDHTRSSAYMFPALICIIGEWSKGAPNAEKALRVILVALVVTPQLNWVGGKVGWVRPFPVAAFRMATGKDPADFFRKPPRLLAPSELPQTPK